MMIDEARAAEVFSVLQKYWQNGVGIFSNIVLPQDRFPLPEDSLEKAHFLFFSAIPMRGGVNSDDPFLWMYVTDKLFPELFSPNKAMLMTEKQIVSAFLKVTEVVLDGKGKGIRHAGVMGYKLGEHARSWLKNAKNIVDNWSGNILNIFAGTRDFEEAFAKVDRRKVENGKVFGMRRKIFSLFTIWLQEKGLLDGIVVDDKKYPVPLPVDFHCLRVLWATKVIDFSDKARVPDKSNYPSCLVGRPGVRIYERHTDEVALWSYEFIRQNGFSHLALNPAIWVLSRDLCKKFRQNQTVKNGEIIFDKETLTANPQYWSRNYFTSCSFCPIEEYCSGAVPAQPYYRHGLLVRLDKVAKQQTVIPGILPELNRIRGNGRWEEIIQKVQQKT